jgi:hypothetical protein
MTHMLVLALETYTEDGWYGTRRRYYYAGPDGQGFKNKSAASKFKSDLRKYVKGLIQGKTKTSINGTVVCGLLNEFPTYKYMGAGPSYSCCNIEVTDIDLLTVRQKVASY